MAISYRIYSNGGTGGPVDYATPIAVTTDLSFVTPALAPSSDSTFAIRAFDPVANIEEANTDARVRIILDAAGQDVTGRPNPPDAVVLASATGGACRVNWAYHAVQGCGVPDGFHVYLDRGETSTCTVPAATISFMPGQMGQSCVLDGPYDYATYTVAVEAYNAVGTSGKVAVATAAIGLPAEPLLMDPVTVRMVGSSHSG